MPRRRGWILMLLGLVLAAGAGTVVYMLLQQAAPATAVEQLPPTPIPMKQVPVAARLLDLGSVITTTDITNTEVPVDLPMVGVMTDTSAIVGQLVVEPIQQGEYFRPSQLRGGASGPLSKEIPAGRVVIAYPAGDLLSQSRVLREGDRVDLLLTVDIEEETPTETRQGKATNFTLQNINVLRLIRPGATEQDPNPAPSAVLFDMTPQDAVIVKFVKDNGGTIDFSLRSQLDDGEFITEPITQDYLFDNYGFYAPRSSTRARQ
jgi:pilus assembly protein CpaB